MAQEKTTSILAQYITWGYGWGITKTDLTVDKKTRRV